MGRTLAVDLQLNIDNAKRQLNQLGQEAQKAFKSGGANSQSYQQAAQAAAQQRLNYKDALSQQSAFNKALAEEAKLRQQATQAARQHSEEIRRQYSPAGQTLAGAVPGGGILASGLGVGGTAALAGAAAVATAIAAVGSEFNKLGDRARELASTSGNASSQLGQLRSSIERASISTDINATSPGIVGFQKFTSDIGTTIGDAIAHATSSGPERAKALQEKLAGGLGQGNEDWRRLQQQGKDLQIDLAISKQALDEGNFRKQRDYQIQLKNFQVDSALQVRDLNIQAGRMQFDQQLAITKYQENFANRQSQKAYELSRFYATQSYQISQGRAAQDFSINQGDKTFDFKKSMADQSQDFSISQSRAMTSRKNQLFDMAMGGATGLQYLQSARDFNLQQQYAKADLALSQKRETRDFGIGIGRDVRNYNISRARATQDFSIQTSQAMAGRQLDVQGQEYSRRYEGIELQKNLNRQSQDLAINFQKLNISLARGQQQLTNQGRDMNYDINKSLADFNLQTMRANRGFGYATADFAGAARSKDPLGAAGLGSRDASFADAIARNAQQSGQTDLFKQVNDAARNSNNGMGAQIGNAISGGGLNPFDNKNVSTVIDGISGLIKIIDILGKDKNSSSGSFGSGSNLNFYAGNTTYSAIPGVSKEEFDRANKQREQEIQDINRNFVDQMDNIRRLAQGY